MEDRNAPISHRRLSRAVAEPGTSPPGPARPSGSDTVIVGWFYGHPSATRWSCLVLGSAAAAYLWAVVWGDGVPGLEGPDVTKVSALPAANLVIMIAVGVLFVATVLAWISGPTRFGRSRRSVRPMGWMPIYIGAGAFLFGVAKLVV